MVFLFVLTRILGKLPFMNHTRNTQEPQTEPVPVSRYDLLHPAADWWATPSPTADCPRREGGRLLLNQITATDKSASNYTNTRQYLSTIQDNSHSWHLHSGERCCMRRNVEQVWYLNPISNPNRHYEYGNGLGKAAARQRQGRACRCNSQRGHCKWGVRAFYPAVSSDSGKDGTARVHLQSVTTNPSWGERTLWGRGGGRLFRRGNFSGMTKLIN